MSRQQRGVETQGLRPGNQVLDGAAELGRPQCWAMFASSWATPRAANSMRRQAAPQVCSLDWK
jgi:hypothetical protein